MLVVGARTLLIVAAVGGCGRIDVGVQPVDALPGDGSGESWLHPQTTDNFDDSITSPTWSVLQDVGVTAQETGGNS